MKYIKYGLFVVLVILISGWKEKNIHYEKEKNIHYETDVPYHKICIEGKEFIKAEVSITRFGWYRYSSSSIFINIDFDGKPIPCNVGE